MIISDFVVGNTYTWKDIKDGFEVNFGGGGMLKSNVTDSLVLISNHESKEESGSNPYEDKWIEEVLHYTGRGQKGDQQLNHANRTLAESNETSVTVYLFEVFAKPHYIYRGTVELDADPYQVEERDIDGNSRRVYKFPLRLKSPSYISSNELNEKEEVDFTNIRKRTDDEVEQQAKYVSSVNLEYEKKHKRQDNSRKVITNRFERNLAIARYVKKLAHGICALCEQEAPFKDKDGEPYLHAHHIEYLSKGGIDAIENVVAVCPNCHEKIHVLEHKEDKNKLLANIMNRDNHI